MQELVGQITELLSQAGVSHEDLKIERCTKGGNNRTYRVQTRDGVFVAKQYFSHGADVRDRLGAEYSFLTYAEKVAREIVARPYAQDSYNKIALYEFIEGRPVGEGEITETEVDEAIAFFCRLNERSARVHGQQLGNAAEACFSIREHFTLIGSRIEQIQQITPDTEEAQTAQLYAKKLHVFWLDFVARTHAEGINLTSVLEPEQRCISPSDFGFHNALKAPDERIRFLDFEYAGWDDPAKMAGDFFAQLAVPVPEKFFEPFIHKTMVLFPGTENLIRRAKILRPAYQVKWCCIALNVFLPHHLARRKFADESLDITSLHRAQLAKVQRLMQSLEV